MYERVFDLDARRHAARRAVAGQDDPPGERDETAALLAEHGIPVTDEGKARARERLADVDRRMTAKRWKALRARLGRTRSAA